MSCSRTTTQWRRWGSNTRPLGLESSTLRSLSCVLAVVGLLSVLRLFIKVSWAGLLSVIVASPDQSRGPQIGVRNWKLLSYFSIKTYVVGTQKNRLNETVLFSTHNICLNWWIRKKSLFYAAFFFCLTGPMHTHLIVHRENSGNPGHRISDQNLHCSLYGKLRSCGLFMCTAKTQIRQGKWPVWSESRWTDISFCWLCNVVSICQEILCKCELLNKILIHHFFNLFVVIKDLAPTT